MKDYHYTGYNPANKENARDLRKNMTRQEKHLWYDFLRDFPVKFYRQRSIDRYIVDFYCPAAHLVIELEGARDYTEEVRVCDEVLAAYHLKVIRYSNADIIRNFDAVCEDIWREVRERTTGS